MGQPPSDSPATTPSSLHGEKGPNSYSPYLRSATATPSLNPAASHMLFQYKACVAAQGWSKMVFEMYGGGGGGAF